MHGNKAQNIALNAEQNLTQLNKIVCTGNAGLGEFFTVEYAKEKVKKAIRERLSELEQSSSGDDGKIQLLRRFADNGYADIDRLMLGSNSIYLNNLILMAKLKEIQAEHEKLCKTVPVSERNADLMRLEYNDELSLPRKRIRKKKSEVVRNHPCKFPGCTKAYGTDNSLNQHMRIKHPEFLKQIRMGHIPAEELRRNVENNQSLNRMHHTMERGYTATQIKQELIEPLHERREVEEEDLFFDVGEGSMQSEDKQLFDSE